jgi:hypothetical protein
MAWIHVRHRVEDYSKWKDAYVQTEAYKRDHGWKRYQLYSVGGDRKDILVMEEFETLDQARGFVDSPFLLEVMGRAGIIGAPEILVVDELEVGPA